MTETSVLDPEEGIEFRNYSIPQCQKLLPKAKGGEEPLPEGLFWLLCTSQIPTEAQVESITKVNWLSYFVFVSELLSSNYFQRKIHLDPEFSFNYLDCHNVNTFHSSRNGIIGQPYQHMSFRC